MCAFMPGQQLRLTDDINWDPLRAMMVSTPPMQRSVTPRPPWDSAVDFATHRSFCNSRLYPRQITLLRLMFLETEQMTAYDLDVIEEWRQGFSRRRDVFGVQPDIWERIAYLKARGARRFPHIQFIGGRRGSKGLMGGVLGAEQIGYFFALDDWQAHFGVDPGKDGFCHDDQTDVLTDQGWKRFADLDGTELLGTVSMDTGIPEYQRPSRLTKYHHRGEMVRVGDAVVTPDHDMVVRSDIAGLGRGMGSWSAAYRWACSDDTCRCGEIVVGPRGGKIIVQHCGQCGVLFGSSVVASLKRCPEHRSRDSRLLRGGLRHKKRAIDLGTKDKVTLGPWGEPEIADPSPQEELDRAALVGFWLAEGGKHHKNRSRCVILSQSQMQHPEVCRWLESLLDRLGVDWAVRVDDAGQATYRFYDDAWAAYLIDNCVVSKDDHRIPAEFFTASADVRAALCDGHLRGDGTVVQGQPHHFFTSPRLADDIQALYISLGKTARLKRVRQAGDTISTHGRTYQCVRDGWRLYVSDRRITRTYSEFPRIGYDGMVYCATVPNGTLITRRNGHTLVSGNCQVGATSQTQAKAQLFADVRSMVERCVYLQPHIAESKDTGLAIRTPADVRRIAEMRTAKVPVEHLVATLRVNALSASSAAFRGATAFGLFLDEFAFMVETGSAKSGQAIYEGAHPSLDQFDLDGLTYIPSSPWQKAGHAQPLDSKILTPTGWRRMGDLAIGDQVIGSDGTPTTVTALHPQGVRPVYRVKTSDGGEVEAADNHEWVVQNRHQRRGLAGGSSVMTTEELRDTLGDSGCQKSVSIPRISAPIRYRRECELPIDPYALGLLLGDGCITSRVIFGSQDRQLTDVFGEIMTRDFPEMRWVTIERPSGYIEGRLGNKGGVKPRVKKELENLGLMGLKSPEKFVPEQYLRSSPAQRLEVLRGLLDTDGWCQKGTQKGKKTANPMFLSSSRRLAEGVVELARSLGGVGRIREKKAGTGRYTAGQSHYWEVRIGLPQEVGAPFRLERKRDVYLAKETSGANGLVRTVCSVDYVGHKEVQCITVDSPDHLYVTEGYLLTHNCYQLYQQGSVLMSSYADHHGIGQRAQAELATLASNVGAEAVEVEANPTMLVIHLPSWGAYMDWERGPELVGVKFKGAIQPGPDHESQVRRKLRNPEAFAIERAAQWAEVVGQYFDPDMVDKMFVPPTWRPPLEPQSRGYLSRKYRIHCDPSVTGANFAMCIGHTEQVCDTCGWSPENTVDPHPRSCAGLPRPHVVIDLLHAWRPRDFPPDPETGKPTVDYVRIREDLEGILRSFPSTTALSFDQCQSQGLIQELRRKFAPGIRVSEVTFTEKSNQERFEKVKAAVNQGWVSAYLDDLFDDGQSLLENELKFLSVRAGKVIKQNVGPVTTKDLCHDDQTEVLTEHGWKLFRDVRDNERLATRTPEGKLEYHPPLARVAYHYRGDLFVADKGRFNFAITPDHRMIHRPGEKQALIPISEIDHRSSGLTIPRLSEVEDRPSGVVGFDGSGQHLADYGRNVRKRKWSEDQDQYLRDNYAHTPMPDMCAVLGRGRSTIYNRAKKLGLRRGQIGDRYRYGYASLPPVKRVDFARFVGMWLAEGSKMRGKYGVGVRITQTKPEGIDWINSMFSALGWPVTRSQQKNGETLWVVRSRYLKDYLIGWQGDEHELRIPDEVFSNWSQEELLALLEGMLVGDGGWSSQAQRHTTYLTSSRQLADDVQRLLYHVGIGGRVVKDYSAGPAVGTRHKSNHDMWRVLLSYSETSRLSPKHVSRQAYDGLVYCFTVPNWILLTRRGGVAMWSGNCDSWMVVVTDLLHEELERIGAGTNLAVGAYGSTDVVGLRSGAEQSRMPVSMNRARQQMAELTRNRARPVYTPNRATGRSR